VSDRLRLLDDDGLGGVLHAVGERIDWPPEPEIAPAVVRSIAALEGRPVRRTALTLPRRRRVLLLAVAVVVLLAAAALATKLVIDLGALTVEIVPGRPTSLPGVPTRPAGLGEPVTLEQAAVVAGWTPLVPGSLGPPDRVWVDQAVTSFEGDGETTRVVMTWRPGPGLPRIPGTTWGAILMEFDGTAEVAAKVVYEETGSIRQAVVGGTDGYWVTGTHVLRLLGPSGLESHVVTGNVLLWNEAGIVARLETALGKRAAIRIADSM
jgi:hypothetical protein